MGGIYFYDSLYFSSPFIFLWPSTTSFSRVPQALKPSSLFDFSSVFFTPEKENSRLINSKPEACFGFKRTGSHCAVDSKVNRWIERFVLRCRCRGCFCPGFEWFSGGVAIPWIDRWKGRFNGNEWFSSTPFHVEWFCIKFSAVLSCVLLHSDELT